jgi:hypothetical protein
MWLQLSPKSSCPNVFDWCAIPPLGLGMARMVSGVDGGVQSTVFLCRILRKWVIIVPRLSRVLTTFHISRETVIMMLRQAWCKLPHRYVAGLIANPFANRIHPDAVHTQYSNQISQVHVFVTKTSSPGLSRSTVSYIYIYVTAFAWEWFQDCPNQFCLALHTASGSLDTARTKRIPVL